MEFMRETDKFLTFGFTTAEVQKSYCFFNAHVLKLNRFGCVVESEIFMKKKEKVIGIIGGMGPMATADLFSKLIRMTDAACDAEHIHILVDNNPKTPDRTQAILYGTESPLPHLVRSANRLEQAGADFLLIPCITSHYYFPELTSATRIPVMSMIEETAKELRQKAVSKVVLLATDGTRKAGVFDCVFAQYGIEILHLHAEAQSALMDVIYKGVKAGNSAWDTSYLNAEIEKLLAAGAEAVVLGCTELPLAAKMYGICGTLVDPTDILARSAIANAGYTVKG